MAGDQYHESTDSLDEAALETHRAIRSLIEELDAVDWYQQRVVATKDEELRAILAHNRDEEKEHAAMVLEWLRRRDPCFDEYLRRYMFTCEDVTEVEHVADGDDDDKVAISGDGSLGIGSLRRQGQDV